MAGTKHFLDTSVARPLLAASTAYKDYLNQKMAGGRIYGSAFVRMELNRSFIAVLIDFYFFLSIETFQTIGDAFAAWSNKFQKGDLKAIVQLAGVLFNTQGLAVATAKDKESALVALGCLIKRLDLKVRRVLFTYIGKDSVHCTRSAVSLATEPANMRETFKRFSESFDDVETLRDRCRIGRFFLKTYRKQMQSLIDYAKRGGPHSLDHEKAKLC